MALIDIGSRKQLFLDDHLVESMTDAKKGLNPAVKADHNPVLRPERPWEGNQLAGRKIIYEEDEGLFKMWYSARHMRVDPERKRGGAWGIQVFGEDEPVDCLAVSEDGINWERPNLGLVEFEGSKDNNILPPGSMTPSFKDPRETDPSKRYKHMDWTKDTSAPMVGDLYYSPDGFDWTPYEGNPIIDTAPTVGRWGPTYIMGWDPIGENYAAYVENTHHMRAPLGKRIIGRAESPDAIRWSDPETVILQDDLDYPDTEFYELTAIPYEGMYVGLLWIFRTTSLTHHPELVVSRDGVHFERNYREPFIFRGGRRIDFDHHSVYMVDVVAHGDKVLCYYNGTNCRSPESMIELGDDATMAIGLAIFAPRRLRLGRQRQGLDSARRHRRGPREGDRHAAPGGGVPGPALVRPTGHALVQLQRLAPAPEHDPRAYRRRARPRRNPRRVAHLQPQEDRGLHLRRRRPHHRVRPRPGRLVEGRLGPQPPRGPGYQDPLLHEELQAVLVPVQVGREEPWQ